MSSLTWKVISEVPAVLASCVLASWVLVLAPPPWGAAVVLAWLAVILTASRPAVERALATLVMGARQLTAWERAALAEPLTQLCAQAGSPAIDVLVTACPDLGATCFGRRTLLLTRPLLDALQQHQLPTAEATALMMSAAGQIRSGGTSQDGLLTALTLPWLPIRGLARGVAHVAGWIPLVGFAWRIRALTFAVAVGQTAMEGRGWMALAITVTGVYSYLQPYATRRATRALILAGDEFAADHGHAPPLRRTLSRYRCDDFLLERLHRLTPPPAP